MKTYYLKWLPVTGRIKDGGNYLNKQHGTVDQVRGDLHASVLNRGGFQKMKLHMVSRDIKVDDIAVEKTADGYTENQILDEMEIFPELIAKGEQFKVIGEISPGALSFFKEGQEFDEDEWRGPVMRRHYFKPKYYIEIKVSEGLFV